MFREMRRKKQQISQQEINEVLLNNTSGVLNLLGEDGFPYGVPLSYTVLDQNIYFHCALQGYKIDALSYGEKASFTVIDQDTIIPDKFTTNYRSVIAFGNIGIVTEDKEKRAALESLAAKYSAEYPKEGQKYIQDFWNRVCILKLTVIHCTGKANL